MRFLFSAILMATYLFSCGPIKRETVSRINYDSLRIVLEGIVDKDQEIRRILIDPIGIDSPDAAPYIKQVIVIDAENQEKITLILDKYGWIEQSKIGAKAAQAFFYTIQHADTALMRAWFPEFKRLAEMGEADKVECAMMEDRLLMRSGRNRFMERRLPFSGTIKKSPSGRLKMLKM